MSLLHEIKTGKQDVHKRIDSPEYMSHEPWVKESRPVILRKVDFTTVLFTEVEELVVDIY